MSYVHPIFEVLLALRDPPEPKRPLREAIALDTIQYIYSGGSIETIPQGYTRLLTDHSGRPPKATLARDPTVRSLLPRLRLASICAHPAVTPRLREKVLSLPVYRTMEDLRWFLFYERRDDLLSSTIRKRHLPAVIAAYKDFVDSIVVPSRHRRPASTPQIVPTQYLETVVAERLDDLPPIVQRALTEHLDLDSSTIRGWGTWLPRLTLGAASTLRTTPSGSLRALNQALRTLVMYLSPKALSTAPWDKDFPNDLRAVPTYAMFPFRPEGGVRKAIRDLAAQDIRTIGDLQCLHPQAIGLSKEATNPLVRLYVAFDEAASASDLGVF